MKMRYIALLSLCLVMITGCGRKTLTGTSEWTTGIYLKELGNVALPKEANGIFVSGDYAYVACGNAGFVVVDCRNKSTPNVVWKDTLFHPFDISIKEDRAYVVEEHMLVVYDISNPQEPKFLSAPLHLDARIIEIYGNFAYLGSGSEFIIVDISDKNNPKLLEMFSFLIVSDIHVLDEKYVLLSSDVIRLLDVSNPAEIKILKRNESHYSNIVANKDYVIGVSHWISIFDLNSVDSLKLIKELFLPGLGNDVSIIEGFVLVATENKDYENIHLLKFENPKNPYFVADFEISGFNELPRKLFVAGSRIYVCTNKGGLHILEMVRTR